MESITKNRQSAATLAAMIARAYGADAVPEGDDFAEEMGHGWFNVAYALTLRDGRRVVVKIAPPSGVAVMSYETAMMRNEVAALALVQARTDVPVPPVDYADTSGELIAEDWFVMPFIDADNFGVLAEEREVTEAQTADYNEQLGSLNRELNSIVGDHFGPLHGPGFGTWREAFSAMIADVLADGERLDVDLGWAYDGVREVIAGELDTLDVVTEPRFVEWDLWPSNVMVRDGRIVAIIDHERAFYGDPLIEAGFTSIDLAAFGDPEAFVRGYGMAPLDENARRRRRLYSLYLILIMIIETRYRGHRDTRQYDWAREQLTDLMGEYGRVRAVA